MAHAAQGDCLALTAPPLSAYTGQNDPEQQEKQPGQVDKADTQVTDKDGKKEGWNGRGCMELIACITCPIWFPLRMMAG